MARSNGKSLEHSLVFRLRDKGMDERYIFGAVQGMKDMDVPMNNRTVKVALSQYEARELVGKRRDYKKPFKEKVERLVEEKKKEIEDNTGNLLSVKIRYSHLTWDIVPWTSHYRCGGCKKLRASKVYAKIKSRNNDGEIPTPQKEKKELLTYCTNCGTIEED